MPACSKCKTVLSPNAKFCRKCGQLVERTAPSSIREGACWSCLHILESDSVYCRHCGANQNKVSAEGRQSLCPKCKNHCTAQTKFCRHCGTLIPTVAQIQEPVQIEIEPTPVHNIPAKPYRVIERPAFEGMQRRDIDRPLYVCVENTAEMLSRILDQLPVFRRGLIIAIREVKKSRQFIQKELSQLEQLPMAVCMVGSPSSLPFEQVRNFDSFVYQVGDSPFILTDNFFGALSVNTPSESERIAGNILGDCPVSRIPFDDESNIFRLLSVEDDLEKGWRKAQAVIMAGPNGFFKRNGEQVLEWCLSNYQSLKPTVVPPSSALDIVSLLRSAFRLYVLLHGNRNSVAWVGHSSHDQSQPTAIENGKTPVPAGATVLSQSCFGAYIEQDKPALSRSFLESGASAFVGSTIIAWGASCAEVDGEVITDWGTAGYASEQIAAVGYANLDAGLPLARALWEAKRTIAQAAIADPRLQHLPATTHNTCLSFVAYGAPWARVKGASRMAKPTPIARPKVPYQYHPPPAVLSRYRRLRAEGWGPGGEARERLQASLGPEAWKVLSQARQSLSDLTEPIVQHIHTLLEPLNVKAEQMSSSVYSCKGQKFSSLIVSDSKAVVLMTMNEEGDIVNTALKLSSGSSNSEKRYFQADDIQERLVGVVQIKKIGQGSFFEREVPVLFLENGQWLSVVLDGDSEFVLTALLPYVGKKVSLQGEWSLGEFRVSTEFLEVLEAIEIQEDVDSSSAPSESNAGELDGEDLEQEGGSGSPTISSTPSGNSADDKIQEAHVNSEEPPDDNLDIVELNIEIEHPSVNREEQQVSVPEDNILDNHFSVNIEKDRSQ